jgi:hypothetical protein
MVNASFTMLGPAPARLPLAALTQAFYRIS